MLNLPEYCMLTVHGSHLSLQSLSHSTQYLTQNDQNSTRKSLHVNCNFVYSQICHKSIHIMGGGRPNKQRNSNLSEPCFSQNLLWASCCWDVQGISCCFVPFQSNSRHCNVHGSCAATENWMQCGISLKHSFGQIIVNCHILSRSTWNLCTSIHQNAAR